MVDLTASQVPGAVRVVKAELGEPLPFSDNEFDLVICPLGIHYAADRSIAFEEFFRVLRAGRVMVLSTQHPTTDWLRKGGSYFDVKLEKDVWHRGEREFTVQFWREPLTAFCDAIARAGFLIERLVEPLPAPSMRTRYPESWEKLQREPGF